MKTNLHFCSYLDELFLERGIFQTIFVQKIKTHILFSVTFFLRKLCPYAIMLKNSLHPDRP